MSRVSECVAGLEDVVRLGSVWGDLLAQAQTDRELIATYQRGGGRALFDLAETDPLQVRPIRSKHGPIYPGFDLRMALGDRQLSDWRIRRIGHHLGRSVVVSELTYRNPIEVILLGSGLALLGVIRAGQLVRDWSANKRIGIAEARKAEAEADQAEEWANRQRFVTDWLIEMARSEEDVMPIGEMARVLSDQDFVGLRRIIELPISLKAPEELGD